VVTALPAVGHSIACCWSQHCLLLVTALLAVGHSIACCWSEHCLLLVTALLAVGPTVITARPIIWTVMDCQIGVTASAQLRYVYSLY
jgi:hypothetical protein